METRAAVRPSDLSAGFLAGLVDGVRGPVIDGRRVAVVVAHSDDETIGCGAVLAALDGVTLVVVTDGAPRDLADARAQGFATALGYAAARSRELVEASRVALVSRDRLLEMGVADQEAVRNVAGIARGLLSLVRARGIRVLVTHAVEGGHPDHDAVAVAAAAAACLATRQGWPVAVVEMPIYRLGEDGDIAWQSFAPPPSPREAPPETLLRLDARERWIKRRMARAYVTQRAVLAGLDLATERFRVAQPLDPDVAPNGGRILYAGRPWGVADFAAWRRQVVAALAELDLAPEDLACRRS